MLIAGVVVWGSASYARVIPKPMLSKARFIQRLSLYLLALNAFAPAFAGSELNLSNIDAYVASKMQFPRIPGIALAIVKDDRVVYFKGYGEADPSGRAITPQTSFLIGSLTKSFTALAVMQLVEAGRVELDAPVQRYIPWFRVADAQASAKITVRQLLYQTSGLPMIREAQLSTALDDGALERTVRALADEKLNFPPGKSFEYSNSNYEALGLIVQYVSGQSYEGYLKQHIFAPLEMKNSYVSQSEALQYGMASGHQWWFGIPIATNLPYNRSELPAGYVISSAEDISHYAIAQMNGGRYRDASILSPAGIELMHTVPAPDTYGMGWENVTRNGRVLVNHDGGTANFQCSLFFDPQEKVGVFIAANVISALDAFSSPHGSSVLDGSTTRAMAQTILSMATGQPLPDQGRGKRQLYTIFDLVLLALTIVLLISLVRIPRRFGALRRLTRSAFVRRGSLTVLLHLIWPLLLLYLVLNVVNWRVVLFLYEPALGYWLSAVAVIVFLKGFLELILLWRVFRQETSE